MVLEDIGSLLFNQLLKVSSYPGAPFTGNIMTDLVLYFFLPMIMTILIIYMVLARLFPSGYKGIRLLVGVGLFLFIIFSGYFSIIISLTGPYFTFLLVVFGIIMFFTGHFRSGGATATLRGPANAVLKSAPEGIPEEMKVHPHIAQAEHKKVASILRMPELNPSKLTYLDLEEKRIRASIDRIEIRMNQMVEMKQSHGMGELMKQVEGLRAELAKIQRAKSGATREYYGNAA